jgi:hypothetical protein
MIPVREYGSAKHTHVFFWRANCNTTTQKKHRNSLCFKSMLNFMNSQAFSMLFKISNEFQTVGKSLIFEPVKGKARDEVKPVTG